MTDMKGIFHKIDLFQLLLGKKSHATFESTHLPTNILEKGRKKTSFFNQIFKNHKLLNRKWHLNSILVSKNLDFDTLIYK